MKLALILGLGILANACLTSDAAIYTYTFTSVGGPSFTPMPTGFDGSTVTTDAPLDGTTTINDILGYSLNLPPAGTFLGGQAEVNNSSISLFSNALGVDGYFQEITVTLNHSIVNPSDGNSDPKVIIGIPPESQVGFMEAFLPGYPTVYGSYGVWDLSSVSVPEPTNVLCLFPIGALVLGVRSIYPKFQTQKS